MFRGRAQRSSAVSAALAALPWQRCLGSTALATSHAPATRFVAPPATPAPVRAGQTPASGNGNVCITIPGPEVTQARAAARL
jgi:hypothetical protein